MFLATQAGASGMIVGQRDITTGLNAKAFGTSKSKVKETWLWPGTYSTAIGDKKKEPFNFQEDWKRKKWESKNENAITVGCAINAVIISRVDMLELTWICEDHERAEHNGKTVPHELRVTAEGATRDEDELTAPKGHMHRDVSDISNLVEKENEDDISSAFKHVFANQRQILHHVTHKAESNLAFLDGIRMYVVNHHFAKTKWYPFLHTLMTGCALFLVLEMSYHMYRHLQTNGMMHFGILVLLIDLLQGANTSFMLDWWPLYIVRIFADPNNDNKVRNILGGAMVTIVLGGYAGGMFYLFFYFAVLGGS